MRNRQVGHSTRPRYSLAKHNLWLKQTIRSLDDGTPQNTWTLKSVRGEKGFIWYTKLSGREAIRTGIGKSYQFWERDTPVYFANRFLKDLKETPCEVTSGHRSDGH